MSAFLTPIASSFHGAALHLHRVFHFPTTTAITPSYNSSNNALLTKRQCKYANTFKEVDSRRDTMQNLAQVPESEERIATLWK